MEDDRTTDAIRKIIEADSDVRNASEEAADVFLKSLRKSEKEYEEARRRVRKELTRGREARRRKLPV